MKSGTSTLVMHLSSGTAAGPARVGFIVSKAVGNAVVRNRVKRRLRHLARERLSALPGSAVLVVRALPASGSADWGRLQADFNEALDRVVSV